MDRFSCCQSGFTRHSRNNKFAQNLVFCPLHFDVLFLSKEQEFPTGVSIGRIPWDTNAPSPLSDQCLPLIDAQAPRSRLSLAMPEAGGPRFVALDSHVQTFVATLAETERAISRHRIHRPALSGPTRTVGLQGAAQICSRCEGPKFDRAAAGVAYDEPARFVDRIEGIVCAASSSCHGRSMPKLRWPSANPIGGHCMRGLRPRPPYNAGHSPRVSD
jgi:hypothetical protein